MSHVHSQCLQELLGTHSASVTDWPPIASSWAWQWLPTLQPPIGHPALRPHPALLPTGVWLRPLRPPWDQAAHSPPCETETGLLQQPLSEMVLYNLVPSPPAWQKTQPPPTSEGTEAERARTPSGEVGWEGRCNEGRGRPVQPPLDCSPLPFSHFHFQAGGGAGIFPPLSSPPSLRLPILRASPPSPYPYPHNWPSPTHNPFPHFISPPQHQQSLAAPLPHRQHGGRRGEGRGVKG